jgi:hypothetical protein
LLRTAGAALLLLGLAGCVGISAEVPRYRATTERPGDRVTVEGGDAVTFDITSERGIGKAGFERVGPPPEGVIFKLRLKGLEEFRLTWGDVTVRLQYPTTGDVILQEAALTGSPDASVVSPGDRYYMNARIEGSDPAIPLESGYFVVEAPPAFIEDAPEQFRLEWIDFYR